MTSTQQDADEQIRPVPSWVGRRRATMQDVADHVGMSRQLVSVVLRGAGGASAASHARITEAARQLGYHPDDSARRLRQRRSRQLGVLFTMRQPFEVDLVDALYTEAERHGYTLVVSTLGSDRSQQDALDELMRQRIEALFVLTAEHGAGTINNLPTTVPVILLGGPTTDAPNDDIRVENSSGIIQAVDHLVALGHTDIAYIGPSAGPNATERLSGYAEGLAKHGLTERADIIESAYSEEGGWRAATQLLERDVLPTAVICANDRCAFGVLGTMMRTNVPIPGDLSIVGFDDSSLSQLPFIDMTTISPDLEAMARAAIDTAQDRINNPASPLNRTRVPVTLVKRGTTGPVRS